LSKKCGKELEYRCELLVPLLRESMPVDRLDDRQ
jgi:hypothetical protein